ncbi:type II and III secretion system protein [Pandoraea cepalis]|uniref:Type II and III secretion system protein n=1 Tax=Pandoraea cepalis TaxID=2508294 RepID=A0A5E4WNE9_9BURK|nr:type II and III secretion system protein family protein [Pandoraea cepalis]VVE25673.1 type II and III secretion system protein [Pandoraea cepalis]
MKNIRKTCQARRMAIAAVACCALAAMSHAGAQTAAEYGVIANGTSSPGKPVAAGGPVQMTISMAPTAPVQPAVNVRGPNCTGNLRSTRDVTVPIGKSTILQLDEPVRNRTLGDPTVVQAAMVAPKTMYLLGLAVGTTNMIVQGRSGGCDVINVAVNSDAGGLQSSIAQLMPDERNVRVTSAGGDLVLAGRVSSAASAQQVVEIAKAYAKRGKTEGNVLNMLSVDAPQQVMLEVKVAEVSKTLINQMGSALNLQGGFGSWTGGIVSSLLSGAGTLLSASKSNRLPLNMQLDAQKTDNLVKILAEPNLVTLSGQEASFLSGGKIFIPVPQSSSNGTTTITLQQEEFGVALRFLPTVLDGDRINLKVAPEVSELSPTGVTLTSTNVSGVNILPLITTRRASTTVQMRDGETFAIGGLLQNNVSGALKAFPGLGEVPVLGALMRSTSFQNDLTELVFIITPHLVKPLRTASTPPLPTDSFTTPSAIDVYATGNMEGRRKVAPVQAPAPAQSPAQDTPAAPPPQPGVPPSSLQPTPVTRPADGASPSVNAARDASLSSVPAKPAPNAVRGDVSVAPEVGTPQHTASIDPMRQLYTH